jgi:hypothetical protein
VFRQLTGERVACHFSLVFKITLSLQILQILQFKTLKVQRERGLVENFKENVHKQIPD